MRYIFYADVYFLQNFMMKVAALYLALWVNKIHLKISRISGVAKICIASFIGTLMEIAGLLLGGSYSLFIVCVHLIEVPLMIWFVLRKEKQRMMRVIVAGYFFIMLMNSVLEALWNYFGENGSYIIYLLFSCSVVVVGVRIWQNYTRRQKGILQVGIMHQGRFVRCSGFYDSGNQLKDPYTGKGVHIVSAELWEKISLAFIEPVYVPYQALGNETGMLEVYYIDEIVIEGEKGREIIQKCPVGVAKENLFEEKNYEMILNEEVF